MTTQYISTIKEKLLKYFSEEYNTTIPITNNHDVLRLRYNPVIYNQNINQYINQDINPVIDNENINPVIINENINRNIITNLTYRNI